MLEIEGIFYPFDYLYFRRYLLCMTDFAILFICFFAEKSSDSFSLLVACYSESLLQHMILDISHL